MNATIPTALRDRKRWLGWRLINDKKVPHSITAGLPCDATDPANWVTYGEASASTFGLGIALGDGLAGVDLDDCRNPETGDLTSEARTIVDALGSYTEISPSGTGVKVFLTIDWPPASLDDVIENTRRKGLEVYVAGRYFAVTGQHVPGTPEAIEHRDRELRAMVARKFGASTTSKTPSPIPDHIPQGTRDDTATSIAGKLRRQGLTESEIRGALAGSTRFDPPLEAKDIERIAHSVARYAPATDPHPRTETGDAEFFVEMHANCVRFDHRRGRWLVFSEHLWTPPSDGAVHRLARDAVRGRFDLARKDDDKNRMAWALAGESRKRQVNLLALAQNFPPVADRGDGWDADPFVLGCANGIIDLRTGALRAGTPDDRVTMTVRAPYDPEAACPLFEEKTADIFGGDADLTAYVQRSLGYALTGDCREECFFLCYGLGGNGKGLLVNTVGWMLGDYADDVPFSTLEHLRHGPNVTNNDLAKLVGRRFVTAAETNAVRLNESRLKALTGRDPITARFLHHEFFTFEPVAKFWLACNHKPEVQDDSEGFWRRVHMIPFTQSFTGARADKTLKDRLRAEAPGILAWLVRGCLMWQREGLNPPAIVTKSTDQYREESNQIGRFLADRCIVQEGAKVQAGVALTAYKTWCLGNGERQNFNRTSFDLEMKRRFAVSETPRAAFYEGVGVVDGTREMDL